MTRNYSIDVLKFICAILVVFLHASCEYRNIVLPLTRCAVPCFFMISGYLLYKDGGIGVERIKRTLKNVTKIALWATALFVFFIELVLINHGGYVPTARQMLEWVVLNECPFGFHLWYLYAYMYVLVIVLFIDKYKLWRWLFLSVPLLLLLTDIAFFVVFYKEYSSIFVRNFLFVGLSYFALGALLKTKEIPRAANKYMLLGGMILFYISSALEDNLLESIGRNSVREHYVSSTFLALCLFWFLLSVKLERPNVISRIGEKDSLFIYLLHPLFIWILSTVFAKVGMNALYTRIAPFAVLGCTFAFIYCLRRVKLLK